MTHFILCLGDLSDFYMRYLVIHWTNNQSTNLQEHNMYYVRRRTVFQEVDWCYTDQTSFSWLHIIVSKSKNEPQCASIVAIEKKHCTKEYVWRGVVSCQAPLVGLVPMMSEASSWHTNTPIQGVEMVYVPVAFWCFDYVLIIVQCVLHSKPQITWNQMNFQNATSPFSQSKQIYLIQWLQHWLIKEPPHI